MNRVENLSSNITNTTPAVYLQYRVQVTVWYATMTTLCITGCTLSFVLIFIITTSKKLRSRSSMLFINLLTQVALQCGVGMPLLMQSYHGVPLSLAGDKQLCSRTFIIYFTITHCVDWTDLMIAVNRFVAVCLPHRYPAWTRGIRFYAMLISPWLISVAIALLPQFSVGGQFKRFSSWESCGIFYYTPTWSLVFVVLGIALPVTSTFLLYLSIFTVVLCRHLTPKNVAPVNSEAVRRETQRTRKRYRSAKLFFVVFVCYAGCLLPAPIATGFFIKEYSSQPMLQLIFRAVMLLGNALIPVIYLTVGKDYRVQLRVAIRNVTGFMRHGNDKPETVHLSGITSRHTGTTARATSDK